MAGYDVIWERLRSLRDAVAYLKSERDQLSFFQDYEANLRLRRAIERCLHISIESCLDIGRHLIALESLPFPETNKEVFQILARAGIIPRTLLPSLLSMAGFRNLVVHEYVKIDDHQVYKILQHQLGDFDAFARAITDYLESQ